MPKNAVFLIGDPEYASHISMSDFAEGLQKQGLIRAKVCVSTVIEDNPHFPQSEFPGIEALDDADLMVIYTRFRVLPQSQMERIIAYIKSGRPMVGLRTANHAFKYPEDSTYATWNLGFGAHVLGAPWRTHYGGAFGTTVTVSPQANGSPILEGVKTPFHVRSWLYHVLPLTKQCNPLLVGSTEDPEKDASTDNPVAWTTTEDERRVFYTSLGHPEDFSEETFLRLLSNGVTWALGDT